MNPVSAWIRAHAIELKVAVAIVLLAALGYGLWSLYRAGYQAGANEIQIKWDQDKIRRDEAQRDALLAYAQELNKAEVQHDHDQALIDKLHDDADRVRIHLPTCAGDTAAAGQDPNGAAGVLPNRVDQLFAEFQERVGRLVTRCDQLNIDAIRANGSR